MTDAVLRSLRDEMRDELTQRILPFWMNEAADQRRGGVVGLIAEDGTRQDDAPKGCILHARLLWTFSAAYHALGDDAYRAAAERAAVYFAAHFIDPTFGGVVWMVDAQGRPIDERKHVYAQAFAIYALVEHFRATGDQRSLDAAIAIFKLVEAHAHDAELGGYEEAFSREWKLLDDVRLSDVDAPERKSMNTHLHLLEAYTSLCAVWGDARLRARLGSLLELFLARIIAPDGGHVTGFFTADWQPRSSKSSFGHDIETSWLLADAAHVLGDAALTDRVQAASIHLADAVLEHAVDRVHGGIFYEREDGHVETDKEWWPQAEAIVGFLNAYQETGRPAFLDAASAAWRFTREHMLDRRHGEWLRRVSSSGRESRGGEKVGPWKCPYHNTRACLEVIRRVDALLVEHEKQVVA
ncbi:MAG TPA: AGE family epimerase/isomerase [Gemmatimonadaceae bacterium]|jgi:mannobiose 2-epimerase|nr:AGE family epimerase/isomerase [Gemmatimonadaceae bacterium]